MWHCRTTERYTSIVHQYRDRAASLAASGARGERPSCIGLTALTANAACSAGLRIKENKEVYEGEVTELTPEETVSQGQGKVIKHVVIGLRTTKGTKQLKLDPSIYDGLQREKVAPGDVIYIEANSGSVRRVGRCDSYATEFDLEAEQYVPMPKVRTRIDTTFHVVASLPCNPGTWCVHAMSADAARVLRSQS